ncbi:MAG TPA: DUF2793 domain-containing protein [Pseudomonas sp.]|nr:DUF2793 domain-containing protein [Pseudomonas sp.]
MTATTKLALELLANAAANQTLANTTFAQLNQLVMPGVVDKDLAAPPGSPADEALYIVASGNWGTASDKTGQLAYWLTTTNAWQFVVPRAGFAVRVLDEPDANGAAKTYVYTGSAWVVPDASAGAVSTVNGRTGSVIVLAPIIVACSNETTPLTAGVAKTTFRMPYAMTVTAVYAELTTAQSSGSIFTVDINESGSSILSTKLTIDNTETDSATAVTPAVISDTSLAARARITVDIDQIGDGTAKGLKVTIVGYQP